MTAAILYNMQLHNIAKIGWLIYYTVMQAYQCDLCYITYLQYNNEEIYKWQKYSG